MKKKRGFEMKKAFLLAVACLLLAVAACGIGLLASILNLMLGFAVLAIIFLLAVYTFSLHKKFEQKEASK
jgi:4-hydroxybenzoate polyprenyltransferase